MVAGEALLAGHGLEPLARWPARELARHVGTVFQDPEHQFLTGSVRDELLLGPRRTGVGGRGCWARADELLERLRLAHLAEANPFTLSGGEQRRLSVATALATAPALLVLDEPTFGQDRRTWAELLHLLAALRDDGRGICFATHDRAFAHALADRTLAPRAAARLMHLVTPLIPDPAAPLARANPVAKLLAALVLMIALFVSLDAVTALVVLVVLVGADRRSRGCRPRALMSRCWLLGATALSIAVRSTCSSRRSSSGRS